MRKGKLFVISGPSAAGKGAICKGLLEDERIWLSVSLTTRKPRNGEIEGVHYYFVSEEEFEREMANGNLLENAEIYGNRYGTPKHKALEHMESGDDVILEIEMQGALQVKNNYPDAVLIFILPPSLKELRKRIEMRGTESEEQIEARMEQTLSEIELIPEYDYWIINDELDKAINCARTIISAEHSKVAGLEKELINKYKEE